MVKHLISVIVISVLLIPAMGWGDWVFLPPVHPVEDAKDWSQGYFYMKLPKINIEDTGVTITARWEVPQYEFKRVSYRESGSAWDNAKEMELITKYCNYALRQYPGWGLSHFFPMKEERFIRLEGTDGKISLGNYDFEIIIYLSREVWK